MYACPSVYPSVSLSAYRPTSIIAALYGRISVQFYIGGFNEPLSRNFRLGENRAKISGILDEDRMSVHASY